MYTCGPNSQNMTPLKSPVLHSEILVFKKRIERQRKEGERRRGGRKRERKVGYLKSHALKCSTEELSKPRNILAAHTALWLLLTTLQLGVIQKKLFKDRLITKIETKQKDSEKIHTLVIFRVKSLFRKIC